MELEALRYSEADGSWSAECITRVAKFVLGMNPDNMAGAVANDRLLDVVKPVLARFDPAAGKADIEVADWVAGHIYVVHLGDWIIKHKRSSFWVVSDDHFPEMFEVVREVPAKTELDELCDVIYNSFSSLEGELYQALAETAATAVYNAGWRKQ